MKLNDIPKLMPVPFGVSGPRTELLQSSPAGDRKASYKDGFPPITMLLKSAGGLPPDGGNMNQILFELASGQRWSNAGAGYKFNATFSDAVGGYPKGAQLLSNDGTKVYVSTKDDNKTDFNTSPGDDWVTLGNYIGLGDYAKAEDLKKYLAKDQNGADIPDKPKFIENLGLGDAAKRNVGTGVLQIPDMSSFTSSLSGEGWQKLPGGLIIQWGSYTATAYGTKQINFPTAFPLACMGISITRHQPGSNVAINGSPVSRSEFAVQDYASGNEAFSMMALGY